MSLSFGKISLLAGIGLLASSITAQASSCGSVTIADMNWNSATFMSHLDKFIMETAYGCEVELVSGDTMPTGTSMIEKGEPDIAPELWSNAFPEALQKGVAEKRLRIAGDALKGGGVEGFWVPQYMVDKMPELATIEGIKKNAKLFKHPEDPEKGGFYGCPAGWNCQISSENLFRALNLEEAGFELVDPGSGAGLSGSIAKAYERKEGWFGYYWAPTAVLGKYKMVKVDFGSGVNKEHYDACIAKADCVDPKPTMYPSSKVEILTTEGFAKRAPDAFAYLQKRQFTIQQLNDLLAWMEENQADGETAVEHFLMNSPDSWTAWLSAEAAAKVKAALK